MANPINCTWGFHRPPRLPTHGEAACPTSAADVRSARRRASQQQQDALHKKWYVQRNIGIYANYNGVQTWSIDERVEDLYRRYI